jgi:hypothetical protein
MALRQLKSQGTVHTHFKWDHDIFYKSSVIPQKEEMASKVTKPQTQAAIQDLLFILEKLESIVDLEFANSTITSSAA